MKNYYEILQVDTKASKQVIEMAYKALAKQYHPDLNPVEDREQCEEMIKLLNEAREILTDDEKRHEYDIELLGFYNLSDDEQYYSDDYQELINDDGFLNKIPKWIRWIIALPVSFLIWRIAIILISLTWYVKIFGDYKYYIELILEATIGTIIFFYCIYFIVPKHKFASVLTISIILSIIYIFSAAALIIYEDEEALSHTIAILLMVISTIYVNVKVFKYSKTTT